jgi:hypothetical protein
MLKRKMPKGLVKGRETWDGGFDETGKASGHGVFTKYTGINKDRLEWQYHGDCLGGAFSGQGFLLKFSPKGFLQLQYHYDGSFQEKYHGMGTMTIYDAAGVVLEIYTGQWIDGKRHGHGKCKYVDGSTYVGNWEHHRICGEGLWTFPPDSPTGFSSR